MLILTLQCCVHASLILPSNAYAQEILPKPNLDFLEAKQQREFVLTRERAQNLINQMPVNKIEREACGQALGELAKLYHAYSFYKEADKIYPISMLYSSEDYRWPYLHAHVKTHLGESEKAFMLFKKSHELHPDHFASLVYLAESLQISRKLTNEEKRKESLRLLAKAQTRLPASTAVAIGIAKIHLKEKSYQTAVQVLEACQKLNTHPTELNYFLGLAYRGLGKMQIAKGYMKKRSSISAAVYDPLIKDLAHLKSGLGIHLNRANDLFLKKEYTLALAEYQKAAGVAPESVIVITNLGSTLARLGKYKQAHEAYKLALQKDPEHLTAHFCLAAILAQHGNEDQALSHYRFIIQRNENHIDAHFNCANSLRRIHEFEKAKFHYNKVIQLDPRRSIAHLALLYVYCQLDEHEKAFDLMKKSIQNFPEELRFLQGYVRFLSAHPNIKFRDSKKAVLISSQLLSKSMSLENVICHSMALGAGGDFGKAQEWINHAISAAEKQKQLQELPRLKKLLRLFSDGQSPSRPFPKGDPRLAPQAIPKKKIVDIAEK